MRRHEISIWPHDNSGDSKQRTQEVSVVPAGGADCCFSGTRGAAAPAL